jgi:glycosyltransferase involved in cell wall biosynthesis
MKEDKKIAIIGTVGLPAKYGGFETLTEYLTKHLGDSLDLTVFCSSKSYNKKLQAYNNARLIYIPLNANGVQSIFYDIVSMFKALRFADTFLILGVSGCTVLPLIRIISRKKIVVNIDGLEWKRAKWNRLAKWFLKFSEKLAVKFSDHVITDNKVIQDYVTDHYGAKSHLIEYGGDHVEKLPLSTEMKEAYPLSKMPYAFTVCRIEPENNIHIILEAFSQVSIPLLVVGNFSNSDYGKDLVKRFSTIKNIQLCDPIYDQAKLNQLRGNATLYIHGHSAGGTNPSLVEAMCLGLSILAFDVGYNRETTENKAHYYSTANDLIEILNGVPEILHGKGAAMKDIAMNRYTWGEITQKYKEILTRC